MTRLSHRLPVGVLLVIATGLLALPASAPAASKPATLRVLSLASPPVSLRGDQAFTVTGRVRNTGGRTSSALLSFKLRTPAGGLSYAVGGATLRSVGRGRTAKFRARLRTPLPTLVSANRDLVLVVCARRSRKDTTSACRKAARVTRFTGAKPPAPAPAPAGSISPTAPSGATPPPSDPSVQAGSTTYTRGARTLNDTLFPQIGNGGYDATHYDLDLDYVISTKFLRGTSTMTARATQNLSGFSMDLAYWMRASKVLVNGEPATFDQGDPSTYKLDITPATPIKAGAPFEVAVSYGGVEQAYIDPDGSQEGWVPSTTRGAVVVSEPVGAMGWYPNNNVPFDKATYKISIGVPTVASGVPWSVIGPGVLTGTTAGTDTRRFTWEETHPTASYLVGIGIGKYDVANGTTAPTGTNPPVPFTTAVDNAFTTNKAAMIANLNRTPSMLDFYADYYGVNYPFASAGGIVPLQSVGYSLETQTKPIYATSSSVTSRGPSIDTVAHENGHMYFGDYTTLTQWKDIWLNEGMTEFTSLLWGERQNGGPTLANEFTTNYTTSMDGFWAVPPANPPTAADIFDTDAMYTRGSMTMIGVKDIFGEAGFRTLMHDYLTQPAHVYGNTTTEEFIALVKAEDLAARTAAGASDRTARWTEFFRQWLYTPYEGNPATGNKPQMTAANFDTYTLP